MCKKWLFTYFNLLFLCMDLQAINEVKVTYQGQGHTSRSRSNQGQHQIEVIFKERYCYAGWFAFESNAFLFKLQRRSISELHTIQNFRRRLTTMFQFYNSCACALQTVAQRQGATPFLLFAILKAPTAGTQKSIYIFRNMKWHALPNKYFAFLFR